MAPTAVRLVVAGERTGKQGVCLQEVVAVIAVGMEVSSEEVEEAVRKISLLPHVHIKGLMTIAPFVENPEENRPIFAHLRKLSVDIAKKNIDNITMSILSMGMTNDYQVAIEEGATMVRVGTGIFGARDYTHQV